MRAQDVAYPYSNVGNTHGLVTASIYRKARLYVSYRFTAIASADEVLAFILNKSASLTKILHNGYTFVDSLQWERYPFFLVCERGH